MCVRASSMSSMETQHTSGWSRDSAPLELPHKFHDEGTTAAVTTDVVESSKKANLSKNLIETEKAALFLMI